MDECAPLTVEGDWDPVQSRTVKNKLLLYFQSKKRSSGGDCRLELQEGAARATVVFRSEEVRQRVLARKDHKIILDQQTVTLRLSSTTEAASSSADAAGGKPPQPEDGASGTKQEDGDQPRSATVVLDNIADTMSRDLLMMLVENVSGVDESGFCLEVIWESSRAVVRFHNPEDAGKFLAVSQISSKIQKQGLSARLLEAAKSVWVESLPPEVVKDMLELWFGKTWVLPDNVVMIPEKLAAVVTFSDPKVVEDICIKEDHMMRSIRLKVFPYYESLGTALYGPERPEWKMPEPFTEKVHFVVWKFLLKKNLLQSINDQMQPHFCSVGLDDPEVKLLPLPSLLRKKDLTSEDIEDWMPTALKAFRVLMSQYSAFECVATTQAWAAVEKEVRLVVKEDAVLVFDQSRGVLSIAGRADDMKQVRAPVENIVLKAMSQIERMSNSVKEGMNFPPAWFFILQQEGLQRATQDISPDLKLSYDENTQVLTIEGLPAEVYQTKSWILEKNISMSRRQLNIPPGLLNYLQTVDPTDMSTQLFTSRGISAMYFMENNEIFLLGSSDKVLNDAESKMKADLYAEDVVLEDQELMQLQSWTKLNQELLDTYNSSNRKTVDIHVCPARRNQVSVAGFRNPVREVSRSLKDFVWDNSPVQETVRVQSNAFIVFIQKNKSQVCLSITKDNNVSVLFDPERPRITISGARLHVQKAASSFQELLGALFADTLVVDKPGAKKYFQSEGSMYLSAVMAEFSCVVLLQPELMDEEDEDLTEDQVGVCYCTVTTSRGVQVSVSRADICSFRADAVVNAANEDLQHIGGLALALLKAAGPQLQRASNDYITKHRKLQPGEAAVTHAYNLPCKHVIHAVGPRYSDFDKETAVSLLKSAVKESLRQAEALGCSTIALPAISSGIFRFPVQLCTATISQAVREHCDSPRGPKLLTHIHLVDNKDDTVRVMASAVSRVFSDLRPVMTLPPWAGGGDAGASGGHQQGRGRSWSPRGGRGRGRGRRGGGGGGRGGPRANPRHGDYGRSGRVEQTTPEGLKIALRQGNIQDQTTDAIVNTVSEDLNLDQGAVSRAILKAAGSGLQDAVLTEARVDLKTSGSVVTTDAFNLRCQKVFHAVCPNWDGGRGQAEKGLVSIISFCLEEAERQQLASLSFPALGTGNLGFPRDLVSRVLLKEVQVFGRRRRRHLREVVVVVHPSDSRTVECFTREFSGQTSPNNSQQEALDLNPSHQSSAPASFSQVTSPSLGVYQIQMGQLTLEASSGDITKEACDVIINSSNQTFNLQAGVSKAILDGAGMGVQRECSQIVNSPGFVPRPMILTSGGQLPCRNIIHIVGMNDPAKIKDAVYAVLKLCEEHKFTSVAFPALGTGQGGAKPSAVADAMVSAVVEFVRKKHQQFVCSVKILIFQTVMMTEFHNSMKKRRGQEVEEKSILGKLKDTVTSFLGIGAEQSSTTDLVLERLEFEPAVFQFCGDNQKAVSQAKTRIREMIVREQTVRTISDPYISQLSQPHINELKDLQRKLTVSIRLERGRDDQEPKIHVEGLTREVLTADSAIRDIIKKVERKELQLNKAILVSGLVEWSFQDPSGCKETFDIHTNLKLEEALERNQSVKIQIKGRDFTVDPQRMEVVSVHGGNRIELTKKDLRANNSLPSHWDDMKGDIMKLFPLVVGCPEYKTVETEVTKTGLTPNIISIDRVQNTTLWQSYQILKKGMETKNKHQNNERVLFHGTQADSTSLINSKGFNRGYAGKHGAMYGNGSYFAVDPAYSARGYAKADQQGHKRMYQARVLVGDYIKGKSGMIAPPSKSTNAADLYDSVTDDPSNPTMFVIFNDIQAYPEYLITFT